MDVWIALILTAEFLIVLHMSSSMTITNAIKISEITGLGKSTVGFSLIAFSTSLPEFCVALISAFTGEAAVSVGNVLGSNIVNINLIVGLAALIISLRHKRKANMVSSFAKGELSSLYFGLFISSIIPLSLLCIAEASWLVGFVLIAIFVIYTYQLTKIRIPRENGISVSEIEKTKFRRYLILTLLGVFGVVLSAYFLVESAVSIAELAGISRTLIGATVIAFGTSLPEFTLDMKSFLNGHLSLAFGDIIGSSFVNTTLILGITLFAPALLGKPLTMNMLVFQNLVIFSLMTNLFFWYFLSMERIGWKESAILLFIYILFVATSISAVL